MQSKTILYIPYHAVLTVRSGVVEWLTHLTNYLGIAGRVGLNPVKGKQFFFEQETLHALLSTGWYSKNGVYKLKASNTIELK